MLEAATNANMMRASVLYTVSYHKSRTPLWTKNRNRDQQWTEIVVQGHKADFCDKCEILPQIANTNMNKEHKSWSAMNRNRDARNGILWKHGIDGVEHTSYDFVLSSLSQWPDSSDMKEQGMGVRMCVWRMTDSRVSSIRKGEKSTHSSTFPDSSLGHFT